MLLTDARDSISEIDKQMMKYISADNNMTAEIFSSFVARLHIPIDKNEKILYYIYKYI